MREWRRDMTFPSPPPLPRVLGSQHTLFTIHAFPDGLPFCEAGELKSIQSVRLNASPRFSEVLPTIKTLQPGMLSDTVYQNAHQRSQAIMGIPDCQKHQLRSREVQIYSENDLLALPSDSAVPCPSVSLVPLCPSHRLYIYSLSIPVPSAAAAARKHE